MSRYIVELSDVERKQLGELTRAGTHSARKLTRARTLLLADEGKTDAQIAEALRAGESTVYRVRKAFVEHGLDVALAERPRPGGLRKLTGKEDVMLVAIACSKPPEGRCRWTLQLLADALVAATDLESVSRETIRRRLAENELKPWQRRMWCIGRVDTDYVAAMEDVLDVYALPLDPQRPLVCFDETLKQLVAETRSGTPAAPGQPERYDYEYRRNGTANLFMMVAPHQGWRYVKVTERKTNKDFAECMRDLVDVHHPTATLVRLVLDNLSTHRPAALYEAFPPEEARRILRRLEFHYTPKHGSWLNMAELEIGVLSSQCLDRRIPDAACLEHEVQAWGTRRNADGATIKWMFSLDDARRKLGKHYPSTSL